MAAFLSNLAALFKFLAGLIVGLLVSTWYQLKSIFLFFVPKFLRFKDVSNDLVLVTGGASGLGRLMAIRFAKLGARVIVWDLNLAGLEETAKMIEELRSKRENVGKCYCYQVDIGERANVYATAERIKQEIGTVTIVVNNAGVVTGRRFLECTDEQILKTFNVNTLAHFWILKAFLPAMIEMNHGHIVSVASIAGLIGAYQLTDYCSSKHAAVGLEESLRLELDCDGYDGIHSTVVCPYYINTGMFAGIGKSLIPILTPEYVVNETVKAVLVNQEVVYLPSIVYFLLAFKGMLNPKAFTAAHKAIGAASTMKTFVGRNQGAGADNKAPNQTQSLLTSNRPAQHNKTSTDSIAIKMGPDQADIGISIPDQASLSQGKTGGIQLNQ